MFRINLNPVCPGLNRNGQSRAGRFAHRAGVAAHETFLKIIFPIAPATGKTNKP